MVQFDFGNARRALRQKFESLRNLISAKEFRAEIGSVAREWASYMSDGP